MMESDSERSSVVVTGKVRKKGAWSLTHTENGLILASTSGDEQYTFAETEFHKKIELENISGRSLLIVSIPERCGFEIAPGDTEIIREWLGPIKIDHLKTAVRQTGTWYLPVGIFIFAYAFFGQDGYVDLISAGLGSLMILMFVISRIIVHPVVFLLGGLWCVAVAASCLWDLTQGGSMASNAPILLFLAWCAKQSLGEYRKYQSVRQQKENVEQPDAEVQSEGAPSD